MSANQKFWVLGHRVTYVDTKGDYSLLEVSATPSIPGPPPHYHEDAPELFHVIEGELDVLHNGSWQALKTGDSLIVPRKGIHTFQNRTSKTARFVTTWSPRGFERFFLDFGVPIDEKDAFNRSIADEMIQRVVAGCSAYGMVLSAAK